MPASDIILNIIFYVLAIGAGGGAVMVAISPNIIRSAFYLLAVLFSVAGFYVIMKADFIAIAQVLIYVGGILVLIIFAIMLTHRITDVNISNQSAPGPVALMACSTLAFALLVIVFGYGGWDRGALEVKAKVGDVRLTLLQYQADGETGLAPEGDTFEPRVVLMAKDILSTDVETVRFQVKSVLDDTWKDAKIGVAKVNKYGEARVEMDIADLLDKPETLRDEEGREINEGKNHWRVRLYKGGEPLGPWSRSDDDKTVDFTVYRGVTEPLARALAGPYLFAFEAVSVLLLAALVGAAFLARKEVR